MILHGARNTLTDNEFVSLMRPVIPKGAFKACACNCVREFFNLLEKKKSLIERELKMERHD